MSDSLLVIVFLALFSSLLNGQKLADDAAALLQVKKLLISGAALQSWDLNSSDPCSWLGISCSGSDEDHQRRVVSVNLTGVFLDSCSGSRHASWENVQAQKTQAAFMADPSCFQAGGGDELCKLHGALAPEVGNLTELQALILPFNSLTGEIPREVGKLEKLQFLELQQNGFTGGIPPELGNLSSLQVLNLEGNSLEGLVPVELGSCGSLVQIRLGGNKLRGGIPVSFGSLTRLVHLSVPSNELNYPIPTQLQGTCKTLEYLDLGNNYFIREIPAWLGNCSKLEFLVLKSNYFVGVVPWNLGQLKMLRVLDISMNRLSGQVPASLGSCLELRFLVLTNPVSSGPLAATGSCVPEYRWGKAMKQEFNEFSGPLPGSITSLPKLQIFWAPQAAFSGELPDGFGACRSLMSLNLAKNNFTGELPPGLSRCSSLRYLDLSSNQLRGELPEKLPASCMLVFNVSRNNLSGVIPAWERNLSCGGARDRDSLEEDDVNPSGPFLMAGSSRCGADDESCGSFVSAAAAVSHDLSMNEFTGPLPAPFIDGEKPGSYSFLLSGNQLSGNISSSFFSQCGRVKAFLVDLSRNQIEGELSEEEFGACQSLVEFNASRNRIGNGLPKKLASLRNLTLLDLSHNRLRDRVPAELGELRMLKYLVLANNSLTGEIPPELSRASSLSLLDLSSNKLSGGIPSGLGNLSHLESLILNNNMISGIIPETLIGISSLVAVNLAYNNLSGAIPENGSWVALCDGKNFQGNPYLKPCASFAAPATSSAMQETSPPVASPQENSPSGGGLSIVVIVAITSGCAVGVVLFVLALLVQCTKQRVPSPPSNNHAPGSGGGRKEVVTFTSINFRFTYENVVRATGNFSVDYLIGNGGFGATYKAEMMPGLVVAVKRLAIGRFQGVQGVQQFDAEIRTLGRIRHPNLVTLIGYHASEAEMFLIYNYFPRGNLDNFIHNRSRGEITWLVVHRIALGIADALAYLHDECVPRVLHRDIKPSNILLDNSLTAFLSDFGLARLLGTSETHATTDVAGTFGYVAPEYAMTCRVSEKADVYSYGVVLLELLSGKKALDAAFSDYGHGFNIVGWACLLIGQGRAHEVFIVELWEMGPENYLLETLKLAVMCTVDSLTVRPTMRQVVDRLRHIASSTPYP